MLYPVEKIIVGLGNPGKTYSWTRHNIGAEIVRSLALFSCATLRKDRALYADISEIEIDGKRVLLAVPQAYMNVSGDSVSCLIKKTKISPSNLLIVFDDLETVFGAHKLTFDGGTRGHNGIRSIHAKLQTTQFFQLRFGIGRPIEGNIADYVLSRFTESEMNQLSQDAILRAKETIYKWVLEEGKVPQEEPKK